MAAERALPVALADPKDCKKIGAHLRAAGYSRPADLVGLTDGEVKDLSNILQRDLRQPLVSLATQMNAAELGKPAPTLGGIKIRKAAGLPESGEGSRHTLKKRRRSHRLGR